MRVTDTPPAGWDDRAQSAWLSTGFAAASAELGHHPVYVEDDDDLALVLVRSVPLPVLDRWTRRAKVFVARRDPRFLRRLADLLRARGVSHVRIGDHRHAWRGPWPRPWPELRPQRLGDMVLDDVQADAEAFLGRRRTVRQNLAKARRAGVEVSEVRTARDLADFRTLIGETSARMTAGGVNHVYPPAFFPAVWRHMVPRGQALMLLARADGRPLAGHVYFVSPERLIYYHGGSTRNRALTPKQGPTAVTWHAIERARARGDRVLDMGGVNLGDRAQTGVTDFKQGWGARHVMADVADVVLSPAAVLWQELVLLPMWKYAHPVYVAAIRRRTA